MICQYPSEQNVKFLLEGGEVFLEDFLSGTVAENLPVHGVDGPCHDITVILRPMGQIHPYGSSGGSGGGRSHCCPAPRSGRDGN